MTYTLVKTAALLSAIAILAACGSSPPSNHYILTAVRGDIPTRSSPSLGIGPVAIPEYLKRNGMVYNRAGNQLMVSSTERWAEPLEDGIKRVLSMNLAQMVNTQNVRFFPWNRRRHPDYGITINVLLMDANTSEARLVAEWLIYQPASAETVIRRISRVSEPLPGGELTAAQIAPAYSELLRQLSEIIAEAILADEKIDAAAAAAG